MSKSSPPLFSASAFVLLITVVILSPVCLALLEDPLASNAAQQQVIEDKQDITQSNDEPQKKNEEDYQIVSSYRNKTAETEVAPSNPKKEQNPYNQPNHTNTNQYKATKIKLKEENYHHLDSIDEKAKDTFKLNQYNKQPVAKGCIQSSAQDSHSYFGGNCDDKDKLTKSQKNALVNVYLLLLVLISGIVSFILWVKLNSIWREKYYK